MKRVLIVEDNENNMELISFILEANDYETIQAVDGLSGVEMALTQNPDFVILDIQLPDIDGLEVLKRIRASEEGSTVPVIAMTSYAMAGDRERLLEAGCNGYIEKPIDPERVIAQIEAVLASIG
ncbi:MAG: response regulator [Sulfurimonadaceae bacterium]|nr:response regulator [Sulfurimonadaceae bacterium]